MFPPSLLLLLFLHLPSCPEARSRSRRRSLDMNLCLQGGPAAAGSSPSIFGLDGRESGRKRQLQGQTEQGMGAGREGAPSRTGDTCCARSVNGVASACPRAHPERVLGADFVQGTMQMCMH